LRPALCAIAQAQQAQDNQANNTFITAGDDYHSTRKSASRRKKPSRRCQLQIFNQSGETVYDSGVISEPRINWPLPNAGGEAIKSGLYAYTLSIKNRSGNPQLRRGHFIVIAPKTRTPERPSMDHQPEHQRRRHELTVAKHDGTTIAGTSSLKAKAARQDNQH